MDQEIITCNFIQKCPRKNKLIVSLNPSNCLVQPELLQVLFYRIITLHLFFNYFTVMNDLFSNLIAVAMLQMNDLFSNLIAVTMLQMTDLFSNLIAVTMLQMNDLFSNLIAVAMLQMNKRWTYTKYLLMYIDWISNGIDCSVHY